ncbi:cation:proton antiporter [Gilvimarinus sp. SDUM040013]|uniref:Cation:proton antiporter family protein n=1 Tax=Gilvimarinus gilvus TaxID=3058038 RepID=A0ABU4RZ80_9GAMM|nr:cation:proton antiporter family protein [Gilvimarinus sp. SDUM040013]MDO3387573.1 cation:proton antiporter [Gilvimarinus sp. SDUM040013]MDX6850162.1 cation:proton antiporter family protein [Gilvimarinus sp. SDUM040013]
MLEAVWIALAFTLGLMVRAVGLPPLVGYLAAGFAISGLSHYVELPSHGDEVISHLAHLGVLLLLFTVGLKLRVRNLVQPEVIGGGLLHFALSVTLLTPGVFLLLDISWYEALLLGVALSFSSTVLAAKVLDSKRELRAFHGRVAIGILVIQDLLALLVISLASGTTPSAWALLVLALPLMRPLLFRLLDVCGHDELMVLLGLLLALVVGGLGFEALGLSSELGALAFGVLLAKHKRATELSNSLWSIKEVFLVGFFLQIGMSGLPGMDALVLATAATIVLPLKGLLFFLLLVIFKLRARSAFLTSLALTNYSEFGLIVAAIVLPQWLVPLALTVAVSFVISAPLNRIAHPFYERLSARLLRFERNIHHPDQQPISLGNAEVLIFGMGRTGTAAYEQLKDKVPGLIALDSDPGKVDRHRKEGRAVLFADAEDQVFWQGLRMDNIRAVILSMSDIEAKMIAVTQLRQRGFEGFIASHTLFQDEADKINAAGANETYLTMSEAGVGLAEHVQQEVYSRPVTDS